MGNDPHPDPLPWEGRGEAARLRYNSGEIGATD